MSSQNGADVVQEANTEGDETADETVIKDIIARQNRQADRIDSLETDVEHKQATIRTLETRVGELETELESVKESRLPKSNARVSMATLAEAITGREIDRSNDMVESASIVMNEFERLRDQVCDLEAFAESFGDGEPRNPDEAWYEIIKTARNLKENPNHKVGENEISLFVGDLEAATGYSDRHCSNLIEQYGENKQGTRWVEHERPCAQNNHNARRKQLVVDLDVWGETA